MTTHMLSDVKTALQGARIEAIHPGLRFHRLLKPGNGEITKRSLADLAIDQPFQDGGLRERVVTQLREWLTAVGAELFELRSKEPLALHLAAASVAENAAMCFHPIYGFPYIPGSGLKGLARNYAETYWVPAQTDPTAAFLTVERIFGWAPGSRERRAIDKIGKTHTEQKPWIPLVSERQQQESSARGSVIFHDAYPTTEPQLQIDIVNPHYPKYYQGNDLPVEWDSPVPVPFLSLVAKNSFLFALQPCNGTTTQKDLETAKNFLLWGLTVLGAGAKTASGYGRFSKTNQDVQFQPNPKEKPSRVVNVSLLTPAFYAGNSEDRGQSCTFRGGTLRGLLRYWWRTIYTGILRDPGDLRRLERIVWGGVGEFGEHGAALSSPVSISVVAKSTNPPAEQFNRNDLVEHFNFDTPRREQKRTSGLGFVTFGMSDGGKQRYCLSEGAWAIQIAARRPTELPDAKRISPRDLVDQTILALWLLCQLGGSGSKARHGFGALTLAPTLPLTNLIDGLRLSHSSLDELVTDMQTVVTRAQSFAISVLGSAAVLTRPVTEPASASLPWLLEGNRWQHFVKEYQLRPGQPWVWMDQIGNAKQSIAKRYAHQLEKRGLGLPRTIPSRQRGEEWLIDGDRLKRHASPIHSRPILRNEEAFVRILAFPSKALGGFSTNSNFLHTVISDLQEELEQTRAAKHPNKPWRGASRPNAIAPVAQANRPRAGNVTPRNIRKYPEGQTLPKDMVDCQLIEEKTKKGGWKFRELGTGQVGPISNSAQVPSDKKPGDIVKLKVIFSTVGEPQGSWTKESN